jgi:hypothetical protein
VTYGEKSEPTVAALGTQTQPYAASLTQVPYGSSTGRKSVSALGSASSARGSGAGATGASATGARAVAGLGVTLGDAGAGGAAGVLGAAGVAGAGNAEVAGAPSTDEVAGGTGTGGAAAGVAATGAAEAAGGVCAPTVCGARQIDRARSPATRRATRPSRATDVNMASIMGFESSKSKLRTVVGLDGDVPRSVPIELESRKTQAIPAHWFEAELKCLAC